VVSITRDDNLFRRLAPDFIKPDGRVASVAYKSRKQPDPNISVNLARLSSPEATRASRPTFGVGSVSAAVPIDMGLTVQHDPQPDNCAHTLIRGACEMEHCYLLAEATQVILPPDLSAGSVT